MLETSLSLSTYVRRKVRGGLGSGESVSARYCRLSQPPDTLSQTLPAIKLWGEFFSGSQGVGLSDVSWQRNGVCRV